MSLSDFRHLKNLTGDGRFRQKIEAVMRDAASHGYDIKIYESLRTKEEQAAKKKAGLSKTMRSKHLPGRDGLARAVDIADGKTAWGADRRVWLMIGRLALTKGLVWGGLWGLPRKVRRRLEAFLMDQSRPFDPLEWVTADGKPGPIGWDPAHIEAK